MSKKEKRHMFDIDIMHYKRILENLKFGIVDSDDYDLIERAVKTKIIKLKQRKKKIKGD